MKKKATDPGTEQILRQRMDQIENLLSEEFSVSPEICLRISAYFRNIVIGFLRDGAVPEEMLDYCHTLVGALERADGSKKLIANPLFVEMMIGYLPALVRFSEQNYFQYL